MVQKRPKRKPRPLKPHELTEDIVLLWCDQFHERTGQWPQMKLHGKLTIEGSVGIRWKWIDSALLRGSRGLPGGSSIPRLLAKHRGVRNRKGLSKLTHKLILKWAEAYHKRHGRWPIQDTTERDIPESPGDGWQNIDDSMRRGLRGLPGGYSLARLLEDERGVRNFANLPPLSEAQILKWCDAYHERTGRWPGQRVWMEEIPESGGETWCRVDQAMKIGIRSLSPGDTLSNLLARTGRHRNMANLPMLTEEEILKWARRHQKQHGKWPTCRGEPQEIEGTFGERWFNIDQVMRKGMRGLPGGSSLARMIAKTSNASAD